MIFTAGNYQECLDMCSKFCSGIRSKNDAVLISGGWNWDKSISRRKVELYNLKTKTSCELPDLPGDTYGHTSVGGVLCGGLDSLAKSCLDITKGSWSGEKYLQQSSRYNHVRWNINPGESFMLLGGMYSQKSTDIVHVSGKVEPGFALKYVT